MSCKTSKFSLVSSGTWYKDYTCQDTKDTEKGVFDKETTLEMEGRVDSTDPLIGSFLCKSAARLLGPFRYSRVQRKSMEV